MVGPYDPVPNRAKFNKIINSNYPKCPICGGFIPNNETPGAYMGALSRKDNKTEICSDCGIAEALIGPMTLRKDLDDFLGEGDHGTPGAPRTQSDDEEDKK